MPIKQHCPTELRFVLVDQQVDAIKKVKLGQVEYKTDKAGIIHVSVGKISFSAVELKKNIEFLLQEI